MTIQRNISAAAACLLLAGCTTVGPDFHRPGPWWSPASWGAAPPSPKPAESVAVVAPVDPQWWKLLGDPLLTSLETKLVGGNLDLRIASIRLEEARAELGVTRSALYPTVDANASYLRQQQSKQGALLLSVTQPASGTVTNGSGGKGATPNGSIFKPYDLYQAGFDASWELDLWGRVKRSVESSTAQLQATAEQRRDTLVTASAELARDYIQLRGVQRKLDITRENLKSSQQSLNLTQERAAGGVTNDLDVANAAAQVEDTAAQIPALQQSESQLMNAVALLLGEPPRALEVELSVPRAVPPVPPRVPVGLPSELARRRPDIRHAEALLHSATANVGVAVGDFYPRITLSGSADLNALQFAKLADLDAGAWTFGPSVSLPIFEGARLTRTLDLREASEQEAAVNYQRTVLSALHEVDNALTAYDTEQHRRDRLEAAVTQNRRALSLAQQRYQQGVADFLQVLIAQRSLLDAEQELADSTTTVSTNLVALYKALGGGWQTSYPAAAPQQQAKVKS